MSRYFELKEKEGEANEIEKKKKKEEKEKGKKQEEERAREARRLLIEKFNSTTKTFFLPNPQPKTLDSVAENVLRTKATTANACPARFEAVVSKIVERKKKELDAMTSMLRKSTGVAKTKRLKLPRSSSTEDYISPNLARNLLALPCEEITKIPKPKKFFETLAIMD